MPYILKGESFQMVDGLYRGKQYERGHTYADVPPTEMTRFKEVKAVVPVSKSKPVAVKKNAAFDDKPKTSARSGALIPPQGETDKPAAQAALKKEG